MFEKGSLVPKFQVWGRWIRYGALGVAGALLLGCTPRHEDALSPDAFASSEGLEQVAGDLFNDPDRMRRMRRLVSLLEQLPVSRFPEVVDLIEDRVVIPRQEDLGLVMHAWARADPEAAFAQSLEWHERRVPWTKPLPYEAVAEVVFVWSQDPSADFGGAVADAPADLRPALVVAAVRGLAWSGQIPRATDLIRAEHEGFSQQLVVVLVQRLVEGEGVDEAIAWAEAVDGPLRVHAFRQTAGVVARRDPEKAVAWAEAHRDAPYAVGMPRVLAQEWARRSDPRVVMDWIETLPDEDERRIAATWVFQDWHRRDSVVAMEWVQARTPLAIMYRPVLAKHTRKLLADEGPGEAIGWVEGIADADRQRDTRLALATIWLKSDPEAAQEWIREMGLEEAVAEAAVLREKRKKARASSAGAS